MTDDRRPFITLPTPEELRARPVSAPPSSYNFGIVAGMGSLLAAHPRIGPAMQRAFSEIMFAPGALDRAEREMVAAVASAAQDCEY
jgi:alkylhydroperoxidase/carboxymuconolactone decarboxylase family protein YurZ